MLQIIVKLFNELFSNQVDIGPLLQAVILILTEAEKPFYVCDPSLPCPFFASSQPPLPFSDLQPEICLFEEFPGEPLFLLFFFFSPP